MLSALKGMLALLEPTPGILGCELEDVDFIIPVCATKKPILNNKSRSLAHSKSIRNGSALSRVLNKKGSQWDVLGTQYRSCVGCESVQGPEVLDSISEFRKLGDDLIVDSFFNTLDDLSVQSLTKLFDGLAKNLKVSGQQLLNFIK